MNEFVTRIGACWNRMNNGMVLLVFLVIYAIIALWNVFPFEDFSSFSSYFPFYSLGIFLASGFFFWWCAMKFFPKPKSWRNLVISLLITFLIWHYGAEVKDLVWIPVVSFAVVFAKFFLYYRGISLVNPAVFGLLAGTFFVYLSEKFSSDPMSGAFVSWWGVNAGQSRVLLILAVGWFLYESWKTRKYFLTSGFLLAVLVITGLHGGMESLRYTVLDPTLYFLASVMLLEPKTSSIFPRHQIVAGISAAIFGFSAAEFLNIPYGELWALVLVNLLNVYFRLTMLPKPSTMQSSS